MAKFWCFVLGHRMELGLWQRFHGGWYRSLDCTRCGENIHRQISAAKNKPLDVVEGGGPCR